MVVSIHLRFILLSCYRVVAYASTQSPVAIAISPQPAGTTEFPWRGNSRSVCMIKSELPLINDYTSSLAQPYSTVEFPVSNSSAPAMTSSCSQLDGNTKHIELSRSTEDRALTLGSSHPQQSKIVSAAAAQTMIQVESHYSTRQSC